jgi:hypothetical protein
MSLHDDLSKARWRKASRSSASGSDCVELAHVSGVIAVRDSKRPNGVPLLVDRRTWRELAHRFTSGELDI